MWYSQFDFEAGSNAGNGQSGSTNTGFLSAGKWWHAQRELKGLGEWTPLEERRFEFYSGFVQTGDLAFDVGANIGNRTKIFRRLGARVIALEPQTYCQSILKRAFKHEVDVVIVPAATGREEGTSEMKIASGHVVSSLAPEWIGEVTKSGRFGDVSWDKSISCSLTTLDKLIATYGVPSFIKIDVEGYESEVIASLSSAVAGLSFEFTPEYKTAAFACIEAQCLGDDPLQLQQRRIDGIQAAVV